jgi:DNA-binding NarL/FixJ family response regulator
MLTTTDDQREVDRCHALGCNVYLRKPVDYDKFTEAIRNLGGLVSFAQMPKVGSS